MNNQQLLNDITTQLEQLLDEPRANINTFAGVQLEAIIGKIENQISDDKDPEIPEVVILIEGGIIQKIEATRGDIQILSVDKDLDSDPEYYVKKQPIDNIMIGKNEALKRLIGTKNYMNLDKSNW